MTPIRRAVLSSLLLPLAMLFARPAIAQEDLGPILDRGYIAHWLVCGPFPSDIPGGILGAVQQQAGVLGDTDFMTSLGGIARTRPDHLMRATTPDGGEAIWQRAGANGPELDLKPFFPSSPEGIAYAAFYANAPQATAIFLDVQSPLGVRIWANGFPAATYAPAPLDEAGLTELVVPLRPGSNLVVMEVPGADYEALARTLGVSTQELAASTMTNRPRLRKTSGFALSTRVRPATRMGKLYYVPDLEDAGTFSGAEEDPRQDTWLTLYNPEDALSDPVDLLVSTPASPLPDLVEVEPIDARTAVRVPIAVPVKGLADGASVNVNIRMHSGGTEAAFNDTVTTRSGKDQPGVVRVITGHTIHRPAGDPASESAAVHLESVRNQILFQEESTGYGFDLGYPVDWHIPYAAMPDLRPALLTGAQQGAWTVRAPFAPVDERIVGGLLLWRNLQLGLNMNQGLLKSATPHYLAWNTPGIAPQTPQLIFHTPVAGMVSDLYGPGLAALTWLHDLHGGTRYFRHKRPAPGPSTPDDLLEMAAVQRRELLTLGIPTDVLVVDNVVPAPEPFYRGNVANLARAFPRVVLDDSGAAAFFEEINALGEATRLAIPPAATYLNQAKPGDLLLWPGLKAAHAQAAKALGCAETLATLASFQGAQYPHAAMDFANRQLAFYSTPAYLSAPETRDDALDALAGFREVLEVASETMNLCLGYLAGKIDTAGAAPLNQGEFQGIVVFNPLGQITTLPVELKLPAPAASGYTLVDERGQPVPFTTRPYQDGNLLEFMAADLPSLGYRTYFIKPEGTPSTAVPGAELQIENDLLALFVDRDTGAIAALRDKRTDTQVNLGPLNQVLFLSEDEARNDGGRELWTSPPAAPPAAPATIVSEYTAYRETLIVTTPVHGGTLEQRYTLRAGQPWVDCETRLSGVDLRGRAAFASFTLPHAGRSLVVGERFGAILGARGQADSQLRTDGADNASGTVSYPAHEWAALTPADAIQIGPDAIVPWEPAVVIHGADEPLVKAASDLQKALIQRGITSILHTVPPAKPDFLWTDATTEQDSNAYLRQGYRMRVVIGSPDQNPFCRALLAQVPGDAAAEFARQIPQGSRLFLMDENVPEGMDPLPTLLLAGLTPAQSASETAQLSEAVAAGRRYLLPPSANAAGPPQTDPNSGCAILFPGSMGVSQQRDGTLLLALAHRAALEGRSTGARLADLMGDLRFHYAIHPFQDSWREAAVPENARAAYTIPPAALTGTHPGKLPASLAFFAPSQPGLRLEGLKPAGFPQTANNRAAFHPRNGFTLIASETRGEAWKGDIITALPILEARRSDAFDAPLAALTAAGRTVSMQLAGFEIQPVWLLPSVTAEPDGLGVLGRAVEPGGPIATRYWKEHRGAAPIQHLPLGVLLRGTLAGSSPVVEAVISNHLTDKTIEGTARLSASSDMSFGPQEFPFSLPPGRTHVEPIQIAFTPGAGADRGLALEAGYERQTYRDVLMSNEVPYTLSLSRNGAQLRAEIRNDSSVHAQGYLDLITAPGHWPETGSFPAISVSPRRAAVAIPPYKSQTLVFAVSDPAAEPEAVAKLAANGTVQYQFFPRGNTAPTTPAETPPPAEAPVPPRPRGR